MESSPIRRPHFFFTTAPMPCPYLDGRMERKIVTELAGQDATRLHDSLSRAGFRRSHSIAYAPACPGCGACVPVRVIVKDFRKKKSFRRTLKANADLSAAVVPARATAEQYRLFNAYQGARHAGSDMAQMGFYDYRAMVEDSPIDTEMVEFRDGSGRLTAVCLMDRMDDGLSAVYSFFDPAEDRQGLGTFMVLWLIGQAKAEGRPFVYLGYWIAESRKMAYKIRFQPLEGFTSDGWSPLRPAEA
jgi:arginine-tRNA-protein transferase